MFFLKIKHAWLRYQFGVFGPFKKIFFLYILRKLGRGLLDLGSNNELSWAILIMHKLHAKKIGERFSYALFKVIAVFTDGNLWMEVVLKGSFPDRNFSGILKDILNGYQ